MVDVLVRHCVVPHRQSLHGGINICPGSSSYYCYYGDAV